MRTLKKSLALVLALVMVLGLGVVGASADNKLDSYTDTDDLGDAYVEAMGVMTGLGIINGIDSTTLDPDGTYTREQAAKIIAYMQLGKAKADSLKCTVAPFDDVAASRWSAGYIGYCAGEGIIGGDGLGSFRPKDNVTAQELAKMLLVILGQDPETYSGAGWAERVNADAQSFGIYYGLTAQVSQPVTRDNACLLIYNAMRCPAIADPDAQGLDRYVLDDLMNPRSYLEVRYDLTRYTAVLTGNEYADLTTNDGKLAAGTTKLAGHKDFAVSSDLSLLGRTVDIYMKDGRVVGIPCYVTSEVYYTFENAQALSKLLSGGALTIADDAQYYLNYNEAGSEILTRSGVRLTVIDHDNDTQLDTILAVNCEQAEISSVSPLRVKVGDEELDAEKYCLTDVFSAGERVWYMEIGGQGFVQPRSET